MNRRTFFGLLASAGLGWAFPEDTRAEACTPPITGKDIQMWEIGGRTIFPVICNGDSFLTVNCCFPFVREGNEILVYRHEVTANFGAMDEAAYQSKMHSDAKVAFAEKSRGLKLWAIDLRENLPVLMPQAGQFYRFIA